MTKSQIKAELRRAACESNVPWVQVSHDAWFVACGYTSTFLWNAPRPVQRIFFLLVAEAL